MKKVVYFILVSLFLFASCKKDDTPTQPADYSGTWVFALNGSYYRGYCNDMIIDSEGNFRAVVTLVANSGSGTKQNRMNGTVSSSGSMSAEVLNYTWSTKIGIASGNFSGNAGSGTYTTNETIGTWTATKK